MSHRRSPRISQLLLCALLLASGTSAEPTSNRQPRAVDAAGVPGACCQNDGTCTDVLNNNDCPGGNFYPEAVCNTPETPGFICNPADSCDYDHTHPLGSTSGVAAQVFTDLNVMHEWADNFLFKGTTDNSCVIDRIRFSTFHYNHQAPNCAMHGGATCFDTPDDYEGLVLLIAEDIDGPGPQNEPACQPRVPVDGNPPYHDPLGPNCREIVLGADSNDDPPPPGNYWTWTACVPADALCYVIEVHLNPPLTAAKNATYWVGFAPILSLADKYRTALLTTPNFDGNRTVGFASDGAQQWEPYAFGGPPKDLYFHLMGLKITDGPDECGGCRLYMDFEPHFCFVDVGDIVAVLAGYSEVNECSTTTTVGTTPGSQVWDGGCPAFCTSDADCVGDLGVEECVAGYCCDVTDISEVLAVLDMFADIYTPDCPHLCRPHACELPPSAEYPMGCCRDAGYLDPNSFPDQGTTFTDCSIAGGTSIGPNIPCEGNSALPVCNSP